MIRPQVQSLLLSVVLILTSSAVADAQKQPGTAQEQGSFAPQGQITTEEKNVQEYIELLRRNVRQEKAEIMGAVMQLDPEDAAKFWPIYSEYDSELAKLNNVRVENIKEYARSYENMNDEKADELIQKALQYHKQRSELLAKYYERIKRSLGAIQAARFVQVENQLLLIIDLQINSALPIVEES